ncbi:hypothetical protein GCM10011511_54410 [Puia dinghuensis]|uniref:Uncharacterized protein n=2 Tax=Puia dinghuensis TaxID=1792502 RepID=A0A8J2XU78_9BACT|nr:hypothetical protein GCM10011511_54410 [Puia dinghuensis]
MLYYWYLEPEDVYNDELSIGDECFEWWVALGGMIIDQNPMNGTLIVCGYLNDNYPHSAYPAVYLYAH